MPEAHRLYILQEKMKKTCNKEKNYIFTSHVIKIIYARRLFLHSPQLSASSRSAFLFIGKRDVDEMAMLLRNIEDTAF